MFKITFEMDTKELLENIERKVSRQLEGEVASAARRLTEVASDAALNFFPWLYKAVIRNTGDYRKKNKAWVSEYSRLYEKDPEAAKTFAGGKTYAEEILDVDWTPLSPQMVSIKKHSAFFVFSTQLRRKFMGRSSYAQQTLADIEFYREQGIKSLNKYQLSQLQKMRSRFNTPVKISASGEVAEITIRPFGKLEDKAFGATKVGDAEYAMLRAGFISADMVEKLGASRGNAPWFRPLLGPALKQFMDYKVRADVEKAVRRR